MRDVFISVFGPDLPSPHQPASRWSAVNSVISVTIYEPWDFKITDCDALGNMVMLWNRAAWSPITPRWYIGVDEECDTFLDQWHKTHTSIYSFTLCNLGVASYFDRLPNELIEMISELVVDKMFDDYAAKKHSVYISDQMSRGFGFLTQKFLMVIILATRQMLFEYPLEMGLSEKDRDRRQRIPWNGDTWWEILCDNLSDVLHWIDLD